MADPQMNEFYGRLKRVERIHRRGGGFEAEGTLGRPRAVERRRSSWLRPLLLVVAGFLFLKALLLMQIGPIDYQERVDRLSQGTQVEQVGAWAMQMDPATVWVSHRLRELLKSPV